ncbi:MAG: peptidoglycan DL-endopeptidase CwlO [Frankiales bacterium]|nr:peptidoglycan DL-endopeptidase CwlO [Frankiales bacterium]
MIDGHLGRRRLTSAALVATFGVVLVGIGPSSPAAADVAQQIREGQAQLDALNLKAEAAAESFNAGRIRLADAQRTVSIARAAAQRADTELNAVRHQVDVIAATAYSQGGSPVELQVLSGGSPQTFLDQMTSLTYVSRSQQSIMSSLQTARHRQEQATADAQTAVAQAEVTLKGLARDRTAVQTAAGQAQQVLAALQLKQQQLIQAARDAATRKAAQARAAQLASEARATALAAAAFRTQPVTESIAPAPTRHYSGNAVQVALQAAQDQLGKPYQWGAAGPDSFDCSGLTLFAYAQAGISLPHYTGDQWNQGRHVSRGELQPGDLVFFEKNLGHVGMYVGNGNFIHAPHSGDVVKISSLTGWYDSEYAGAVRLVG